MKHEKLSVESVDCSKYVSYDGKTKYSQKPETLTSLNGNVLINKTSPVIKYRGMLDYL